jgi:hypothetical protein
MCVKLVSHIKGRNRPRVIENTMLTRISGTKRDEVIRGWKKNYEELYNLYFS